MLCKGWGQDYLILNKISVIQQKKIALLFLSELKNIFYVNDLEIFTFYVKLIDFTRKTNLEKYWVTWLIEQKGMTFDYYFCFHSPFLLPSFLGGKRKGEMNNQIRGQKSCLSTRSLELTRKGFDVKIYIKIMTLTVIIRKLLCNIFIVK